MDSQISQEEYIARYKRLRNRLILLFSSTVLILSTTVLILNIHLSKRIDEKEDISYVINTSGRQRMLSQNIAKTSLLILHDSTLSSRIVQLDSLTRLFENSHSVLMEANLSLGSNILDQQFEELEFSYRGLLEVSKQVQSLKFSQELSAILLNYESTFLPKMDLIVKEYERLGRAGFQATNTAVKFSNYLIIVLLLVAGIVAFFVASKMVKSYSLDLEQMSTRLDDVKVELERAKLRERFAYVASHDLQEPIRSVISLSELLQDKYMDDMDSEVVEIIRYIHESSERMSRQVGGLLDYSRLGKNQLLQEVDLNDLLKDVEHDLHTQITRSKAEIQIGRMPIVNGYPIELRSMFQNLLQNAIKFYNPSDSPKVVVSFRQNVTQWVFSIEDNGIGIDPVHKEKIFQLFQRLNSREAFDGFGIGLAHCQRVAELHRGSIWVDSEPGKGSVFSFSISKALK